MDEYNHLHVWTCTYVYFLTHIPMHIFINIGKKAAAEECGQEEENRNRPRNATHNYNKHTLHTHTHPTPAGAQ